MNKFKAGKLVTPRPHAELIKQWADDDTLEIEYYYKSTACWYSTALPEWYHNSVYRIKPPVKSPQEIEKDKLVAELEVIRKRLDELDVGG